MYSEMGPPLRLDLESIFYYLCRRVRHEFEMEPHYFAKKDASLCMSSYIT
jgi:hypothetical protein